MKLKLGFLAFFAIYAFVNINAQTGRTVGPLIQTQWSLSTTPYNDMLPLDSGRGSHIGCDSVAIAQLMKYHRHPLRGNGHSEAYTTRTRRINVPSVNLNVVFDWTNMLNNYTSSNPGTTQQRNAVAQLMYNIAVSRKADFTAVETYSEVDSTEALIFWGYDKSMQVHYRSFYSDNIWEAIIREQLDAGLPVFYQGYKGNAAHVIIADGYDSAGRFHFNMGWGGHRDGWYFLNDMPEIFEFMDGIQYIITNIKPNTGSVGSNEMALNSFIAGKTSVVQNELFAVTVGFRGLGFFPGGQAGVALVDNNGRIVEVIGSRNYPWTLNPGYWHNPIEISCTVPNTVRQGQYNLRIITRLDGGEWKIATVSDISNDVPNAINFTVTAERGAPGGGYGLGLRVFSVNKTTVARNETFAVSSSFRNFGSEIFSGGQAGVALVDSNGNIVEVIGSRNYPWALEPGYWHNPIEISCTVPNTVRSGRYQLRIVIRPTGVGTGAAEWRIATLSTDDVPASIDFTVR